MLQIAVLDPDLNNSVKSIVILGDLCDRSAMDSCEEEEQDYGAGEQAQR
jgi:hypothetical protein